MKFRKCLSLIVIALCLAVAAPGPGWGGGQDIIIDPSQKLSTDGSNSGGGKKSGKSSDSDTSVLRGRTPADAQRGRAAPALRGEESRGWAVWARDLLALLFGERFRHLF